MIQRALILCQGEQITPADILLSTDPTAAAEQRVATPATAVPDDFKTELHDQEHKIILATLKACAYKRKAVAEKLGISDRTLRYKLARMRESGIELPA